MAAARAASSVEGSLNMLKEANRHQPDDPIHDMIRSIKVDLDRAHKLWPGGVSQKVLNGINHKMIEWEKKMFPNRKVDVLILSSLGLALLADLAGHITDPRKRQVISAMSDKLIKLHEHFDPEFTEYAHFRKADEAFRAWKEIQ